VESAVEEQRAVDYFIREKFQSFGNVPDESGKQLKPTQTSSPHREAGAKTYVAEKK
jgi:hypothetical protein